MEATWASACRPRISSFSRIGRTMSTWKLRNRSHAFVDLCRMVQWRQLENWASQHPGLYQVLTPDTTLFGEWLYARHSIHYTQLPDLFLAFDIYDKKKGRFLSRESRDRLLEGTGIHTVPLLGHGKLSRNDYDELLKTRSAFHDGFVEGIYVRIDEDDNVGNELAWLGAYSEEDESSTKSGKRGKGKLARGAKTGTRGKGDAACKGATATASDLSDCEEPRWSYIIQRAKVVRPDFLPLENPDIKHWSRQKLVKNVVQYY